MDSNRICKKVFLWDYMIWRNSWSAEVKDIMAKIGLIRNFETFIPCNLADVKLSLQNAYANDWPAKTLSVPKLRIYVTFKTSYSPEKYVLLNMKRNERSMQVQFRCSILPLRIETGDMLVKSLKADSVICVNASKLRMKCIFVILSFL